MKKQARGLQTFPGNSGHVQTDNWELIMNPTMSQSLLSMMFQRLNVCKGWDVCKSRKTIENIFRCSVLKNKDVPETK